MNHESKTEETSVKRPDKGKGIYFPERYGMVFCSNCNGSGKYFYGNEGAGVCQVCGGFGLVRMERHSVDDASGMTIFVR